MTTAQDLQLRIDGARLLDQLDRLRAVGATVDGGVSRLAFTAADVAGRDLVADFMRAAGLEVRVDPAGNLIGSRAGRLAGLPALVLGSHLDTVPGGGAYDGAYGVVAAVEVLRTLRDRQIQLDRRVDVVAFSNEEGASGAPAMFGSRAVAGRVTADELRQTVNDGRTVAELLDGAGGDSARIEQARWPAGTTSCYLELHIEQGPILEAQGLHIGVVEGISGRQTVEITVHGETNHGGTTPMESRKDALVAAAEVVLAVPGLAGEHGLVRVATVGDCRVQPGAWNVIPGQARLVVDLRDLSTEAMIAALAELRRQVAQVASRTGTDIEVTPLQRIPAALCDKQQFQLIEEVASSLRLRYRSMPSGAGHDAQWIAEIAPIGMVFVPSHGGASHVAREWTDPADLINGADVLLGCTLAEGMAK
ncbi:MAG TPA: Zn-dependent hydrolase [Jatrophihabitans sp.]|jgi:N-carbamoyl-L-amino-acid hydrolase|uniref:Zn-dependent hydrolase n=1 Tax=Jatrophihabitans sp. TaxID=1932789 RepID=UPI002F1188A4